MPRNVLEDFGPKLAALIEGATDQQKRAASIAACRWAIERVGVDDSIVETALEGLARGDLDAAMAARVQKLAEHFDAQYFDAEERCIAGHGDEAIYLALADKAWATYAVSYAFDHDPFQAATQSIYQACGAVRTKDAPKEVEALVEKALQEAD